jgi:predicted dehydrogenase
LKDFEEKENLSVVAVCDVFEKRRRKAQKQRRLATTTCSATIGGLENKDIDVVVIATPDHWHAPIAIDAMEAGKHLYIEKPMTHTLDEAFDLYKTAKRTDRLVQVGSHGCSDPKWHRAKEIISANRLGRVLWAQGSYCRNNVKGEWNYDIDPDLNEQTVDWKMWLGKAKKRPFSPERYFRWRKYWDYGMGSLATFGHRLHPLILAMR